MKTIGNLYSLFAASDNRHLDVMHQVKHSSYPPSKWRLQHDIMILLMRLGRGEKHALSIYLYNPGWTYASFFLTPVDLISFSHLAEGLINLERFYYTD